MDATDRRDTIDENRRSSALILAPAGVGLVLWAVVGLGGDWRERLPLLLAFHAVLVGVMLWGWWVLRRHPRARRTMLVAAVLFRLAAAAGEPALSDDVHRYVWDGRLQWHGVHPYRHAPDDPALRELRDESWRSINHPELRTIYPPLAEMLFLVLAAVGAGPIGFKLALGGIDFGVVLALGWLLRKLLLPDDRLILYAWNPLAILESSGSGHVEPLGVLLVLLAAGWIIDRWPGLSTLALGAAIQVKLLPVVLVSVFLRRYRPRELALLVLVVVALALPYAVHGPPLGAGLVDYAQRWERNAVVFPAVRGLVEGIDLAPALKRGVATFQQRFPDAAVPWDLLYRHVWPQSTARIAVALVALAWMMWLLFRPGMDAARHGFLVLGGVLLLSPTLHPWYLLWVLPFAAAYRSAPWLVLAALAPLAYFGGDGDVPWGLRALEYGPPLVVALAGTLASLRARPRR